MRSLLRFIITSKAITFSLAISGCSDIPPDVSFAVPSASVGFSTGPDLAVGRFLHASVALPDGRVVVTGGFVAPGEEAEASVEVFTPNANLWASGPLMKNPRFAHQIVLLPDGYVLAIGGQGKSGYLATAERLDTQTPTSAWEPMPPMREPRIHFTATRLAKTNEVLVAGGVSDIFPRSEWFDPSEEQWLPEKSPLPMVLQRSYHAAVAMQDGKALVTGGYAQVDADPAADVVDAAEVFDPGSNMWSATTPMLEPRALHTLTLLRDGRVIAIGGTNDNEEVLRSSEVFDPTTGSWSKIEPMAQARTGHQATLLMGGRRLLVTGGFGTLGNPIATAEILDVETMQWTPFAELVIPRFWHRAHLVESDGRVLLVGGVNKPVNGQPSTVVKTEIFTPPCASNLECAPGHHCAVEGVCVAQSN